MPYNGEEPFLKPCPFCVGSIYYLRNQDGWHCISGHEEKCLFSNNGDVMYMDYDQLILDWNTRPEKVKPEEPRTLVDTRPKDICHADRDGDCVWEKCPQLKDGEPAESNRHCPLDNDEEDR